MCVFRANERPIRTAAILLLACAACSKSSSDGAASSALATPGDAGTDAPDDGAPDATLDAPADAGAGGSSDLDAAADADFGQPSDTYPAFLPRVPHIVNAGGPVMASVRVVPIFFPGDAHQSTIVDGISKLAASSHWSDVVGEYGVGALSIASPVVVTSAAPASIDEPGIHGLLSGWLDGTHPEFGAVDAGTLATTVYSVFFPSTTAITYADGAKSCSPVYGYHGDIDAAGQRIVFAALSECDPEPMGTYVGNTTHELFEAATDPHPSMPAYRDVDDPDLAWELIAQGGEVGDLCGWFKGGKTLLPDVGYKVQRVFSNAAMAGFHEPCLPGPAGVPYFAAVPRLDDDLDVMFPDHAAKMKGVVVHVGVARAVDVDFLSDGPTSGAWTVSLEDAATQTGGADPLALTLDRASGVNGEKAHLTITASAIPAENPTLVDVVSTLDTTVRHWPAAVLVVP